MLFLKNFPTQKWNIYKQDIYPNIFSIFLLKYRSRIKIRLIKNDFPKISSSKKEHTINGTHMLPITNPTDTGDLIKQFISTLQSQNL